MKKRKKTAENFEADVQALQRNLSDSRAMDLLIRDLTNEKGPSTEKELELWNFAHNLLAMSSLVQDLSHLEHANRLEIEASISKVKQDLKGLFLRTEQDHASLAEIQSAFFSAVANARRKFLDPRLNSMFTDLIHTATERFKPEAFDEAIEEDIQFLRSALDGGGPDRIQRAVAILKADLNRWDRNKQTSEGLHQRAKLLLAHAQRVTD